MSQKSGDATYVAKSDKDKVIDFVTMLLKEIDKPMAVAEALAKLEDVEDKDGQRVQEFSTRTRPHSKRTWRRVPRPTSRCVRSMRETKGRRRRLSTVSTT